MAAFALDWTSRIVTPPGRVEEAQLLVDEAGRYSITLSWDEADPWLSAARRRLETIAVAAYGPSASALLASGDLTSPFVAVDGRVRLQAGSRRQPGVVGPDSEVWRAPIEPGFTLRASVTLYSTPLGAILAGLNNVQVCSAAT